jgi:peroxiredoxin
MSRSRRILGALIVSVMAAVLPAAAQDVGAPAPEFKLPSTTGADIALSDFRGKKWVLLEFYSVDFAPT